MRWAISAVLKPQRNRPGQNCPANGFRILTQQAKFQYRFIAINEHARYLLRASQNLPLGIDLPEGGGRRMDPGKACVRSTDGVRSSARFRPMREAIRRRPSSSCGFSCRDQVFLHDVPCKNDLSRKPARHRDVSAGARSPSSIMRASAAEISQEHIGRCQPRSRLAHLRGFRSSVDRSKRKLYAEEPFGVELEQTVYALDFQHHDRPLPEPCSLGRNFAVAKGR